MEEEGPPSPPTLFGKYELGRLLGCGAFAKVYLARNVSTGQSVAIKSVSRRKIVKGGFVAHVKREISIMHRVRHPNIVELLEVMATRTRIYFVMELAKGGELFSKVAKGRFSEDLSRRYFQQLITAVGYCHARGVFHRDLKPENLLLDDNWDLKVSDFGLSAVRDQIQPDGLLHTLCGTPAYVAPEILAKKGYDGPKVDIWSCGIILFVLVAGYLPFNDTNLMTMYRKICKGEFRCPKWTSPELRHLLSRLLDTNPDTRITVGDILDDPWFRKGYKQIQTFPCADPCFELKTPEDNSSNDDTGSKFLNAFDIISLSPGLDLSGLFSAVEDWGPGYPIRSERFLSTETPGRIIERVEEVASGEDLAITKRMELGARWEGRNGSCGKMIVIEIDRLTDELVVVHVKEKIHERVEELVGPSKYVWRHKLRPQLGALIYQYPVRGVQ